MVRERGAAKSTRRGRTETEEDVSMAATETPRPITPEQQQELDEVFERARKALIVIETYDQARVDRLDA